MLDQIIKNYFFWLIIIALLCFIAERIKPWRTQSTIRPQFYQDLFWLILNVYLFSLIFKTFLDSSEKTSLALLNYINADVIKNFLDLQNYHLLIQITLGLLLKDFIEWLIHNLLHRVPFLWRFHQLHHSIKIMDWVGNTRYHFVENFIYKSLKYIPLLFLHISFEALLIIDVFSTLIGYLNHSNLNITWGPLKYIFNSPAMHIWHHDKENHFKNGQNFGIIFSTWDWIFQTVYFPKGQPIEIGFKNEEKYPLDIPHRLIWPFLK